MPRQLATEDLILEWLIVTGRTEVSSHEIQLECPCWMAEQGHKIRNPATVDRKWRNLRDDGLEVEELETPGPESRWKILSFKGEPWQTYL